MAERKRDYNLFPPIVDSYMPSFAVEDKKCQILFSISDYNSLNAIVGAEVSIRYQSNNISALANGQDFIKDNEVLTWTEEIDKEKKEFSASISFDKNNGIITIPEGVLKERKFKANEIYKVQIRLLSNEGYSEWSTVCLIKGVHKAVIRVPLFEDSSDIGDMVINIGTLDVNAIVEPIDKTINTEEQFNENIYYYEMYIYKNEAIYEYSGRIYTTDENERNLKYTFKKQLEVNQSYELEILFCTTSNYIQSAKYEFVHSLIDEQMDIDIYLQENDEQGYIEAAVSTKDLIPGSYILLRASSLDDFATWKDIHLFQKGIDNQELVEWIKKEHSESVMDGTPWQNFQDSYIENENRVETEKQEFYIYRDYTVQGGVLYKYKIQNYGKGGIRSLESGSSEAALCYFDYMFLGDKDFQLKIKFDGNLSSPKKNILESKTDTIGGKYPIIRRNGNTQYESFQISGIISAFGDENEFYDSSWKEDLEWKTQYYDKYGISNMRDFVGEKSYRDKVNEFLHDGQVKLFRSMQEGNFLVRLMDISFTPNQQLGRLIGSFQATAYQIADLTIENYFKYNILDDIVYNKNQDIISNEIIFGQFYGSTIFPIIPIKKKYNNIYFYNNYSIETSLNQIKKIKITAFDSVTPVVNAEGDNINNIIGINCRLIHNSGEVTNIIIENNKSVELTLSDNDKGIQMVCRTGKYIIDYEAEIQIQYMQNAFKTQYLSTNIGQLENCQKDIITKLQELYNQNIKNLYLQEIESIDAIEFKNQNDKDCKIQIIYADKDKEEKNIVTDITISANNNYILLSDELKRKEIISIIPEQPININYYYTLSKKYYL